jgi:hypothetical protein
MTIAYLVDTDWVIHWLHDHEPIQRRLEELRIQGLALSAVSLAELWKILGTYYLAANQRVDGNDSLQ